MRLLTPVLAALSLASPLMAGGSLPFPTATIGDFEEVEGWEVRTIDEVAIGRLVHISETADGVLATVMLKPGMMPGTAAIHTPVLHVHDDYLCIEPTFAEFSGDATG